MVQGTHPKRTRLSHSLHPRKRYDYFLHSCDNYLHFIPNFLLYQSTEDPKISELKAKLANFNKTGDFESALTEFDKAVEDNMVPPAQIYHLLLNIASRATIVESRVVKDAVRVFREIRKLGVPMTEAPFSSIIRICAMGGQPELGIDFVQEMVDIGVSPRLRTYAPLLKAFSSAGNYEMTKQLFEELNSRGITPTQSEYECLLRVCTITGRRGEALHILRTLSEQEQFIDDDLAEAIKEFFLNNTRIENGAVEIYSDGAPKGWGCAEVLVDKESGKCPVTGSKLRSIDIPRHEAVQLAEHCSTLAGVSEAQKKQFSNFQSWIEQHGPFDVYIDGPNVGYYGQNFKSGAMMYSQIEAIKNHFLKQGLRVLIVIGERWLQRAFYEDSRLRKAYKKRVNYYAARLRGELTEDNSGGMSLARDLDTNGYSSSSSSCLSVSSGSECETPEAFKNCSIWMPESERYYKEESTPSLPMIGKEGSVHNNGIDNRSVDGGVFNSKSEVDHERKHSNCVIDPLHSSNRPHTLATKGGNVLVYDTESANVIANNASEDSAIAGELINSWKKSNCVYAVPKGFNDDWFWMYAATKQSGMASSQAYEGKEKRPVYLVSNDFMRDHHFQLLAPRSLLTWRDRHQVYFAIHSWTDRDATERSNGRKHYLCRKLEIRLPVAYSTKPQESIDKTSWHFPLSRRDPVTNNNIWLSCWMEDSVSCDISKAYTVPTTANQRREMV